MLFITKRRDFWLPRKASASCWPRKVARLTAEPRAGLEAKLQEVQASAGHRELLWTHELYCYMVSSKDTVVRPYSGHRDQQKIKQGSK